MMANRRLALSLLCAAAPISAALLTAGPAVAADPAQAEAACGASAADYAGTFLGVFDNESGDTLRVQFAEPDAVLTRWSVQGWQGEGKGKFDVGPGSVQWTNSGTVSGPLTGVDSEVYQSVQVQCEGGGSRVTSIAGLVDSGDAQIPFVLQRA
ncbi:hypothetical protein [Actinacidiphila epipremni]|uniref:Uncharacterized protein n=1 Tax=Actinacidiphila epipremni TaxID=2053013 RepID=A0ABX0ZKB6_9ACTN|nr:hypothetical protein [Actinacidiphila epipremni]NJP43485.1 hypothetical protein [Actinacidiphila epipremni]